MNEEDALKVKQIRLFYKNHLEGVFTDEEILSCFIKNNRVLAFAVCDIDKQLGES